MNQFAFQKAFVLSEPFADVLAEVLARELRQTQTAASDEHERPSILRPPESDDPAERMAWEDAVWALWIKELTDPQEKKFTARMLKLFAGMKRDVLGRMGSGKALQIPRLRGQTAMWLDFQGQAYNKVSEQFTEGNIDGWLFSNKTWERRFNTEGLGMIEGVAAMGGSRALSELPVAGISFDVRNPEVTKRLRVRSKAFSKEVVGTTEKQIRSRLATGIDKGESMDKLRNRISEYFEGDTIKNRAAMIARTETIWASNRGAVEGYRQSGVVEYKEWLTAGDERTCFPANTAVQTSEGPKCIQDVVIGDKVLTHRDCYKKVLKTFRHSFTGYFVKLKLKGGHNRRTVTCTDDHPILVNGSWLEAKYIEPGDLLQHMAEKCPECGKLMPIGMTVCSLNCAATRSNKKIWADPKQHERVSRQNRKLGKAQMMRKAFDEKCEDPEFKETWRQSIVDSRDACRTPAFRRLKTIQNRRLAKQSDWGWKNKGRLENSLKKAFKVLGENHLGKTFIEKKVEWWLNEEGIAYEPQKYFNNGERRFWVDFYLPEHNIVVEADGDYFHNEKKDRQRDEELRKVFTGQIVHLLGSDIRDDFSSCASVVKTAIAAQNCFVEVEVESVKRWKVGRMQPVYNFQVEEDESYVAARVVVHNCPYCNSMYDKHGPKGKGLDLDAAFAKKGSEVETEDGVMKITFEDVMHPPLHPRCRCALIPRVKEFSELDQEFSKFEAHGGNVLPEYRKLITVEEMKEVNKRMDTLPAKMHATVVKKKGSFDLVKDGGVTVHPDMASQKGVTPRGWPAGTSWDTVPGVSFGGDKTIVLANHVVGSKKHGCVDLLLHEHAHTIDRVLAKRKGEGLGAARLSTRKNWQRLYDAAVKQRGYGYTRYELAYSEEMFAEDFARYALGGKTRDSMNPKTRAYFQKLFARFGG